MNPYIISSALKDALRPGRIFVWVMVAFFVFVVALVWAYASPGLSPTERYGQIAPIFLYRLLALAAAVFSMGVVAQEIEQKTIVYLLTRTQRRWALALGRWIACVISVTAVCWLATLAAGVGLMGFRAFSSPVVLRDLGVMLLGAAAYSSLFVFVSLLLNRAMIVCLFIAFGWETFAQNLSGMSSLSLLTYMNGLAIHPSLPSNGLVSFLSGSLAPTKPSELVSALVLSGVAAGFILIAMWWFEKFEYSPREDAE